MSTANPLFSSRARSAQRQGRLAGGCIVVFLSLFMLAGLAAFYSLLVRPAFLSLRAQSWIAEPCIVTVSEVKDHPGSDNDTYSIHIEYDYEFQGRAFHGTRYDFAQGSDSFLNSKRKIVAEHPVGSAGTCYVNPAAPEEAVFERGFSSTILPGMLSLIFIAIPGVILYVIYRVRNAPASPTQTHWQPNLPQVAANNNRDSASDLDGPTPWAARPMAAESSGPTDEVILRPQMSRLGTFIASIFICLFWNGIVSVFVWQVVESWNRGAFAWWLAFFLTPFVLIGVGMVFFVFHSFLSLFNPLPTLRLSAAAIPLGDTLTVKWQFSGSTWSVRTLTITLQGEESATYRRGTTSYTDRSVFAKIPLVETDQPFDIPSGQKDVQIPADTMHSFAAPSNKITWTISLHAAIPYWPDVSAVYPFVVLPRTTKGGRR